MTADRIAQIILATAAAAGIGGTTLNSSRANDLELTLDAVTEAWTLVVEEKQRRIEDLEARCRELYGPDHTAEILGLGPPVMHQRNDRTAGLTP